MKTLSEYLDLAAVAHGHLCAGQVLGVRLAMLGLRELGIEDPVAERKRIVTYVEIDRCVTDAVALVAGSPLKHGGKALQSSFPLSSHTPGRKKKFFWPARWKLKQRA